MTIDPDLTDEEEEGRKRYKWWPTGVSQTQERLDMSEKHYKMLSKLIWKYTLGWERGFTKDLMDILEADNPEFDREKFLAACKGEE